MQSVTANTLEWITGSGGPLILLPADLIEVWSGIDAPIDGRVAKVEKRWDPAHAATDYDRACEVDAAIANVDVGQGRGIVLAGDPHPTAVLPRPGGVLIVRWAQAPSEAAILEHLAMHSPATTGGTPAMIEAHPGPLLLFDAACPGPEVEDDRIVLDVHPGHYVASAIEYKPNDELSLVIVSLERAG